MTLRRKRAYRFTSTSFCWNGWARGSGKGEALWKSLLVTSGDIIVWVDTDIVNIHPRFVYGIIGPLLLNPQIQLVKGILSQTLEGRQ